MYIEKVGDSIRVTNNSGQEYAYYPLRQIASVQPIYQASPSKHRYGTMARVYVFFETGSSLIIDMQDVQNQNTWTTSQSGVDNAAQDINQWRTDMEDTPYEVIPPSETASGDFFCLVPERGEVTLGSVTSFSGDYADISNDTIDKYIYGRWTSVTNDGSSSNNLLAYYEKK